MNGTNVFGNDMSNCEDTIGGLMVEMNMEPNDRSDSGGEGEQNDDWLKDKRAGNMDIGGPGGSGSTSSKTKSANNGLMSSTGADKPIRSYMEGA